MNSCSVYFCFIFDILFADALGEVFNPAELVDGAGVRMEDVGEDLEADTIEVTVQPDALRRRIDAEAARQDELDLAGAARTLNAQQPRQHAPAIRPRHPAPPLQLRQHVPALRPRQPAVMQPRLSIPRLQVQPRLPGPRQPAPSVGASGNRFGIGEQFLNQGGDGGQSAPGQDQSGGSGQYAQDWASQESLNEQQAKVLTKKRKVKKPTSKKIPRSAWPKGFTEEDIDGLSVNQVAKFRKLEGGRDSHEGKKQSLPGKGFFERQLVVTDLFPHILGVVMGGEEELLPPPLVKLGATEDNCMDKICDARLLLYPIVGDQADYWGRLPPKYDVIQPEFGAKLRGVQNRVPRATWVAAHDRRRATELKHWSAQNIHAYKQDTVLESFWFSGL